MRRPLTTAALGSVCCWALAVGLGLWGGVMSEPRAEHAWLWAIVAATALAGAALPMTVLLKRVFEADAEIRRLQAEALEARRHAALGTLAATIAHDCNNVASVVAMNASWLEQNVRVDPRAVDAARDLGSSVSRLIALLGRLRETYAGQLAGRLDEIDLGAAVREEVDVVRRHERIRGCTVAVSLEGETRALVNLPLLHQMLLNLLLNAADATCGRGLVEVRVLPSPEGAVLEVHDDGPGVPVDHRARLFDPHFTTKIGGSGLGLPSVLACADAHGGRVEVLCSPLGGALFRVLLPTARAKRAAPRAPSKPAAAAG